MRALELDIRRAELERLVDDEVPDERPDPRNRHVRIQREHLADRFEYAHLDQ
jgi:hypothetical protein